MESRLNFSFQLLFRSESILAVKIQDGSHFFTKTENDNPESNDSLSIGNGDEMKIESDQEVTGTDTSKINVHGKSAESQKQCLKGVARVGVLAKGLLLHGDDKVDLVIICQAKPTMQLLDYISTNLSKYLSQCSTSSDPSGSTAADIEDRYHVEKQIEDSSILVRTENVSSMEDGSSSAFQNLTIRLRLTSPLMRVDDDAMDDQSQKEDVKAIGASIEKNQTVPSQTILERSKCLDALAELRQAKWFQVI